MLMGYQGWESWLHTETFQQFLTHFLPWVMFHKKYELCQNRLAILNHAPWLHACDELCHMFEAMAGQLIFYTPPVDEEHQHLQAVNFINILWSAFWPIFLYKSQLKLEKSCAKHFCTKELLTKCWWNWHLGCWADKKDEIAFCCSFCIFHHLLPACNHI